LSIGGSALWFGHTPALGGYLFPHTTDGDTASIIVVTTASDADNGDVSSVAALLANPGPDGVSLREAIIATNSDPGRYTISFATAFVIQLNVALPPLQGGNVTIQGPVTIRGGGAPSVPTPYSWGFLISSSGNRLSALTVEGFFIAGIHISPAPGGPLPTGVTFADNSVEGLTIRGVRVGVDLGSFFNPACPSGGPCPTHNAYLNTTIVDNVIESSHFGIRLDLVNVSGAVLDGATIARNTIRLGTPAAPGAAAAIQIDVAGWSDSSRVANVTVADNTIESTQAGGDGAIFIGSGLQRARHSIIEDVLVVRNRIHVERPSASVPCCYGIIVDAGSDYFTFNESGFPDDNVVRRVEVSDNEMAGALASGVRLQAGADGGGSRNRVEAVKVRRNVISSTILGRGVYLWAGQIGDGLTVTGNSVTDVEIDANIVTTGQGEPTADTDTATAGGVVLIGGAEGGRNGSISDVRITSNNITTSYAAVRLIGGLSRSPMGADRAQGNSIRCVRITGNRLVGAPVAVFALANVGNAVDNSLSFFMPDTGNVQMPDIASTGSALQDPHSTGC
jgi:hypothetical protein